MSNRDSSSNENRVEIALEEARARIRRQLFENRRYQRQASLFLRISIATLGVVVAFTQTINFEPIINYISENLTISQNVQSISSDTAGIAAFGELVVGIELILLILFICLFFIELIRTVVFAYNAAYPEKFHEGPNYVISEFNSFDPAVSFEITSLSEYREVIRENDRILSRNREYLQKCFDGVKVSILCAVSSALIISSLVISIGILNLVFTLLVFMLLFPIFSNLDFHENYYEYVVPDKRTIIPVFLSSLMLILVFILDGSDTLFLLSILVSLVSVMVLLDIPNENPYVPLLHSAILFATGVGMIILGEIVGVDNPLNKVGFFDISLAVSISALVITLIYTGFGVAALLYQIMSELHSFLIERLPDTVMDRIPNIQIRNLFDDSKSEESEHQ
ncbi:hypothetical protein [Halosimplex amylolyticum]|uniref:hypothetical protein n=1 Tax=Halosimplex amylolyticum TaxID=3396616 RepID=UPI003F54496C